MKKILLQIAICIPALLIIIFGFSYNPDKQICSHKKELDSLYAVIEDSEWQIKKLKKECKDKEREIGYWGRKYENCKMGIK